MLTKCILKLIITSVNFLSDCHTANGMKLTTLLRLRFSRYVEIRDILTCKCVATSILLV